jgi:hypothetical protein
MQYLLYTIGLGKQMLQDEGKSEPEITDGKVDKMIRFEIETFMKKIDKPSHNRVHDYDKLVVEVRDYCTLYNIKPSEFKMSDKVFDELYKRAIDKKLWSVDSEDDSWTLM